MKLCLSIAIVAVISYLFLYDSIIVLADFLIDSVTAEAQAITAIDDKVYFRVVNNSDQNGYYVLGDNNTATQAFNVASGGVVWGFCKLVVKAD